MIVFAFFLFDGFGDEDVYLNPWERARIVGCERERNNRGPGVSPGGDIATSPSAGLTHRC